MSRRLAVGCSVILLLAVGHPPGATATPVPAVVVDGDVDGDGYGADDCAPLDPSVNPGGTDRPDLDFTDVDCDGIDGDAANAVFVSLVGNDAATGTRANPLGTVAAAVTRAAAEGKDVYVAGGTYVGTVALADDVGVYGGYEPGTWSRSAAETTTLQGAPAALAVGDTGVVLQLLNLNGQQDSGGNSYGVRAVPDGAISSQVLLEQVQVTAANGAHGAPGAIGAPGATGAGLPGGLGGNGGCGTGVLGALGSPGAGSGVPGAAGPNGSSGTFEILPGATWSRPSAGAGGQGGSGGGGTGGRGGTGASNLGITLCGGKGGTGGSGGGGGFGGLGGQGGGGSFAIYTFDSSVVAVGSALQSGTGGAGGAGGLGGSGGAPASGTPGLIGQCHTFFSTVCASTGLPGSLGAAGGSGGRGGGGVGGPSAAVYQGGTTSGFTDVASTLVPGTGGAGGTGGSGTGAPGAAAPILRTTGAPTQSTYDFDGDGTADPADQCPADPAAGGCPEAPETTIDRGPANGGYLLSDSTTFEFSSTGGTSYTCSVDGGDGFDCTSPYTATGLTGGTHVFRVWSRASPSSADPTAADRTFTVPHDSTSLQHGTGWTGKTGRGYFLGTFSTSTRKGSALSSTVSGVRDVALVATKGVGFGKVKVMLGSTQLKKVDLASDRTRKKQLIPIASFGTLQSGTVKIVVLTDGKTVRIEGLGLQTG